MVYAISNFDVGKKDSPLHLPLEPGAIFKKQRASKNSIDLQDRVLWAILDQYEITSLVKKRKKNERYYCFISRYLSRKRRITEDCLRRKISQFPNW